MNDWQSANIRANGRINIDAHTKSLVPVTGICIFIVVLCVSALALELL